MASARRDLAPLRRILAVELEKVEGAEHHPVVVAAAADQFEHRKPIVVAGDRLAVDNAGARLERGDRRGREREVVGEIGAAAAHEAHSAALARGDDAEAVVLDLVKPTRSSVALPQLKQFPDLGRAYP
jgi:hypothetical protein